MSAKEEKSDIIDLENDVESMVSVLDSEAPPAPISRSLPSQRKPLKKQFKSLH